MSGSALERINSRQGWLKQGDREEAIRQLYRLYLELAEYVGLNTKDADEAPENNEEPADDAGVGETTNDGSEGSGDDTGGSGEGSGDEGDGEETDEGAGDDPGDDTGAESSGDEDTATKAALTPPRKLKKAGGKR